MPSPFLQGVKVFALGATVGFATSETVRSRNHLGTGQRLIKMEHSTSLSNQIGPQPIAKAKILGKEHEILLDTGSQINAISCKNIPSGLWKTIAPTKDNILSFSNAPLNILGKIALDVDIGTGEKLKNVTFYVIGNDCRTVLGTGTMAEHKITIDMANNTIQLEEK